MPLWTSVRKDDQTTAAAGCDELGVSSLLPSSGCEKTNPIEIGDPLLRSAVAMQSRDDCGVHSAMER